MTRTETDVRELLGSADPLARHYGYGAAHGARAAEGLERILLDRSSMRAAHPRRPRTVTVRRAALAATAAVAAGAVVVTALPDDSPVPSAALAVSSPSAVASSATVPTTSNGGGAIVARPAALRYEADTDETAAEALRRIAASALETPSTWEPATKAKPYTYTHMRGWWAGTDRNGTVVRPVDNQTWMRADGTGRSVRGPGEPAFASEAERQKWLDDGSPQTTPEVITFELDDDGDVPRYLGKLPTTVSGLDALLTPNGPPWDARQKIMAVDEIYQSQVPEPATRAALLEMLAGTTGVTFEGRTVDRADRPGLAFSAKNLERNGTIETVVFDEKTGVLLDSEGTIAELGPDDDGDLKIGDVAEYDLYLGFGRVATETAVPEDPTES